MPVFKKKNIRLKEGIDDSLQIDVPVDNGNVQDAINNANQNDAVRDAISNGVNVNYKLSAPNPLNNAPTATTFSSSIEDANNSISSGNNTVIPQANTMPENKILTKKTIEEARLKNIRENSAVFTKKEIDNLFKM